MAAGAAVLGHPLAAVAMMANHLGERGQEIPAGSFIMTGGVTEAIAVKAGDNVQRALPGPGQRVDALRLRSEHSMPFAP
jgi:2-keto-4-pentenoate hydratase